MRSLVRLFLVLALFAAPAATHAEGDGAAFRAVIGAQLEAFQRDDGTAAFAHASPMIKGMFGTPENFMRMVVQGYPQVYRPRSVDFGAVITYRGQPTQLVYLTGPAGDAVIAYYQMQQQPDGAWQINGVYMEPAANA
jgi:hypothetical protein